jgi:murein L,D-transpeptidase YafK
MKRLPILIAILFILSIGALLLYANWPGIPLPPNASADRIIIIKSQRKLVLLSQNKVLKEYCISLGANPIGAKRQEGDKRTPEGLYTIDYRNPKSSFHLSLHVSYPNSIDIALARRDNISPGSLIMIHGIRNGMGYIGRLHRLSDWTLGCIAVTNPEIEEIWQAVKDGTPVEILP